MTDLYYNYNNYDEYINAQIGRAKKTAGITSLKNIPKRQYIYDRLLDISVTPEDSVLCLGARHRCEPDFFRNKGHSVVDAIDLYESDGIMACDMSKVDESDYFKDKKYNLVVMIESIEHCLDLDGLIRSVNKVCDGYFVCMSPTGVFANAWDCSCHPFMLREVVVDNQLYKERLEEYFPEFDVVVNEVHKRNKRAFFILKKKTMPARRMIQRQVKIWDGQFKSSVERQYKISLCTTCMGRLYNLKETLPSNIKDSASYPNTEFVVVDYNSKDGLGDWIKANMMEHIESGKLAFYRTTEPKYFSMSHSRNIAYKVATGDIVNNLDADNYITNRVIDNPEECFAAYLNRLANEDGSKSIFAKGKRAMHGRIGFFKHEFMDELGGYDEDLLGYGHDDHDLVNRAWMLGYTMYWWGGAYFDRIRTSRREKNANMERRWKVTENENVAKSAKNIRAGKFQANEGEHWGKAHLVKNFKEEIDI